MTYVVASCFLLALALHPGFAAPWAEVPGDYEGQSTRWSPNHSAHYTSPLAEEENRESIRAVARLPRQASVPAGNRLLFANRLFLVSLETASPFPILNGTYLGSGSNAIGLDFDYRNNRIFWTDVARKMIWMSDLDEMEGHEIVAGVDTPDGLALDWVAGNVYWTDAAEHHIEVVDPVEPKNCKTLLTTGDSSIPRAIVVDPHEGSMYWTDWGSSPKIEKASMDGTSRTVLFDTGLRWPNGLTLDYDTQTLYWADAWLDKLESSSTDGTNRQQLPVSSQSFIHPFGLTFHHGHLYWTDWAWNAVFSAPVQNTENGIAVVLERLQLDPMAIHVFTEERQPSGRADGRCENAGCSHWCLLSSSGLGYSCSCPPDMELDVDGKTCQYVCSPPCENGGTCTEDGCECPRGYTGRTCHALCFPECINGQCTIPIPGQPGVCVCDSGWTGEGCNEIVCSPPCQNGGTCTEHGCDCPTGYTGRTCSALCFPECTNGQCTIPIPGEPGVCVCDPGWTGNICNENIGRP